MSEARSYSPLNSLQNFLDRENAQTKGDKMPVPRLNQFIDKPSVRRRFGHVFVAWMLESSHSLPRSSSGEEVPLDPITYGREIFGGLDARREGPEGLLSSSTRESIHTLAEGRLSAAILLGREAVMSLRGHPAHGTATDALLAVELYAVAQTGESAA